MTTSTKLRLQVKFQSLNCNNLKFVERVRLFVIAFCKYEDAFQS